MTHLYPPGRCALEITPEDNPPQDNGAHARLTTPPRDPRELILALRAIHAQLCDITGKVDAISPRVQAAVNALTGDDEVCGDIRMFDILQSTATHFGVTPPEIRSSRRNARLVRPRHVVMYLCKTMTTRSYPEISMFLGGRDHTTVMHAVKVMTKLMEQDTDLANQVDVLKNKILTGG